MQQLWNDKINIDIFRSVKGIHIHTILVHM